MYVCIYIYMYMYMHTYVHNYACIHIHIHIYIYIYIYIHTYPRGLLQEVGDRGVGRRGAEEVDDLAERQAIQHLMHTTYNLSNYIITTYTCI